MKIKIQGIKKLVVMGLALTVAITFLGPGRTIAAVRLTVNPSGVVTSSCYTPADAEAEQAIRLRSELMVIALNCQESRFRGTPENLYAVYRQFVFDHGTQFAAYEKQMLDYFARSGAADPEAGLNEMGTVFGNKLALGVASTRPDIFCYQYAPRVRTLSRMSDEKLRQWAIASYTSHVPTHPMCQ